jgi:hypothetical protein
MAKGQYACKAFSHMIAKDMPGTSTARSEQGGGVPPQHKETNPDIFTGYLLHL